MSVECVFCREAVPVSLAYHRVTGWEKKAKVASRKGGSDILLREPLDEYACTECIARLRAGINVAQETFV